MIDTQTIAGERLMVRFGDLPETTDPWGVHWVSHNHRDGRCEEGVSVYDAWLVGETLTLDLRGVDAASALAISRSGAPIFRVRAERLAERGSDGEPLVLDPVDYSGHYLDGARHTAVTEPLTVSSLRQVLA